MRSVLRTTASVRPLHSAACLPRRRLLSLARLLHLEPRPQKKSLLRPCPQSTEVQPRSLLLREWPLRCLLAVHGRASRAHRCELGARRAAAAAGEDDDDEEGADISHKRVVTAQGAFSTARRAAMIADNPSEWQDVWRATLW